MNDQPELQPFFTSVNEDGEVYDQHAPLNDRTW